MKTEGRVPAYREIQQGVEKLLRKKSPKQSDPFLSVEQCAVETGIGDLAGEHDAYALGVRNALEMVDEDRG
jgi:hypothetical protein